MNGQRIDHTAVVVADLNEALPRFTQLFGVEPSLRRQVPTQGVEVAFLPIGDTQLELIQPTSPESGVARFLTKHGEGLHHIAVLVDNIAAELDRLAAEGVPLIDREPRPGVHGRIAFVRPEALGGVLLELVEKPAVPPG